jgi:hypothetical protein
MEGSWAATRSAWSFGNVRRLICYAFTLGAVMFVAALPLVGWFSAVVLLGTIANFALVGRLFRDTTCRGPGIVAGVLACLAAHVPLTSALIEFVIRRCRVPLDQAETVGYFVGPAIFAFVSLPVGEIACRWWSSRG